MCQHSKEEMQDSDGEQFDEDKDQNNFVALTALVDE